MQDYSCALLSISLIAMIFIFRTHYNYFTLYIHIYNVYVNVIKRSINILRHAFCASHAKR